MNLSREIVLAVVFAVALSAGASEVSGPPAGSGVLWEARTMAAQARQQLQAAAQAGRNGNAEAYREHESKAGEMFAEARRLFDEAGGMALRDTEALADYAGVLQAAGDSDLAAEALRRATRLEPENPGLWLALGRALLAPLYRRTEEAEAALKRAAEAGTGQEVEGQARAVLGQLYWEKGLPDFAEEQWALALKAAPGEPTAKAGMAAVLARRGEMVAASGYVQELAQTTPEALGLVHDFVGKALLDFQRAGLWFEDTAEAHMAYASLLLRVGRYEESVAPLQRAVKLEPENHVAWNMIGSISAQLGRTERARAAFERSLALDPNQERTREALESLPSPETSAPGEGDPKPEEDGADATEPTAQGSGTGASSATSK